MQSVFIQNLFFSLMRPLKNGRYFAFLLFFFAFSTLFVLACGDEEGAAKAPDVSHIDVDVSLQRFEQDLFALDTNNLAAGIPTLLQKYPVLFPVFVREMIQDPRQPLETEPALRAFLCDTFVRNMYAEVRRQYGGDLAWLDKDLTQMFRYYKYYFPEKPVPQPVTMVTAYGIAAASVGDSLCTIGLDMFLGEKHPHYLLFENTAPAYIRRQYAKDYIEVRLAKALAQNLMPPPTGERLLDQMLYNGKMLYITDCLLPATPDSLKMGYTREQMEGCFANEQRGWTRLLEEKLLFSTDVRKLNKLVNPSPNAPVLFQETPGEFGNWLGWRIVETYMARHPKTTLQQLMAMQDSQKFLEMSKYKPKR
jgi:hypothetical protein